MATRNNRDVRLGIEIETAGEDGIKRLAGAVRALAKEGDPAAAEFSRLANELDRLAEQAGAIQSIQALRGDVEKLTLAEREASQAAQSATLEFKDQAAAAQALRTAQAQGRAEVAAAKTAYDDLKLAFQTLKNEGRAAAQSQDSYNEALREARQQVDEQNRALKARRDALVETNRALREAEAAERALRSEYESTSRSAEKTVAALQAQKTALESVEVAAATLGADITDLAAAEANLLKATRAYVDDVAVKRRQVSLEQAEADRLAAIEALGLAEAQERGRTAALSELAAIRDSELFTKQYTQAKADAARATLELAVAEERRVAKLREQSASDALAAAEARGLADAQDRARVAAESELAAIRDSEAFLKKYEAAQRAAAVAAQEMALADERAAAAARDHAAAERAAIAEFNKAAEAAAVTNFWANELNRLDAESEAAAASTRELAAAGELVTKAFGQTGVRSLQAIRGEMVGVSDSLALLKRQFNAGAIGAEDLARASSSAQVRLATLRQELQTIPALPNVFEKINSSINDLISRFGSLTAAVATVGFVAKPILDTAVAFESLRRTLTVVTGSAEVASQQIEFLRSTANKAGLSAGQMAQSFSLFEASLLKSGISLQTTQDLFGGVSNAAGKLGISTDRVNGILLALGQIANKGKVSLEELQGQVGEALPGALKLAADSLGLTSTQLSNLLKEGKLLAEDFLPAFAKQLNSTFGGSEKPVEGLAQAFNRLKNAATETAQKLVDTSAYKGLTSTLDSLARNFDTVIAGTVSLGKAFLAFKAIDIAREFFGIKAAAELAASAKIKDAEAAAVQTLATQKASAAIAVETEALNINTAARARNAAAATGSSAIGLATVTTFEKTGAAIAGATSRLGGFIASLGGPYGLALGVAITFSEQLGNGLAYVAAKATGAVDALKRNEDALQKLADAEKAAAAAAAARAAVVTASFVQVQAAYDKELTAVDNQIKVSEKLVKAKKDEGAASVTLAELSGDEARAKTVAANAAGANEAAIRSQLQAQLLEITLLEQERAALALAAGAQNTWSEARKAFFVDFDQKLAKKKADVEVTQQQAAADGVAADKAFLAAQAYKDNGAQIEIFKQRVADAFAIYKQMVQLFKEGLVTQDQVTKSERDLAVAQGLLKNAYDDATAAIKRRGVVLREVSSLELQKLDLGRKTAEVDQKLAELTGNLTSKVESQIAVKKIDIDQSLVKIDTAEKEAKLLREEAALLQDRLKVGDPLYAQKKREIDATLASAKAKMTEGDIERQNLRGLRGELDALNVTLNGTANVFNAAGNAAKKFAADAASAALAAARAAAELQGLGEKATESFNSAGATLARKRADGTLGADDKDKGLAAANLEAARANLFQAQQYGASSDTLEQFQRAYNEARSLYEHTNAQGLNPASSFKTDGTAGGGSGFSGFASLNPPVPPPAEEPDPKKKKPAPKPAPTPAPAPAPGPSPSSVSGQPVEVTFVFNGVRSTVHAKDQATADAVIRGLEDAYRNQGGG